MKKTVAIISLIALLAPIVAVQAKTTAKSILDKTAAVVGRKGGVSASFAVKGGKIAGTAKGSIAVKGSKFRAATQQAIVWYDGKTQWSYLKSTQEVSVTTPTEAQQAAMNPMKFITMYRSGYKLSYKSAGGNYQVTLTATNRSKAVSDVVVTVNAKTYVPSVVKMKTGGAWTTVTISNFKASNMADSYFSFRAKDFPKAEVIDLR